MLFVLFALSFLSLALADNDNRNNHDDDDDRRDNDRHDRHEDKSLYYDRIIIQTVDSAVAQNVIDANHTKMLAINAPRNVFKQADADRLTRDGINFIKTRFGIDFNLAARDPVTDYRVLPGVGQMFPVFIGGCERYHVAYDSENGERGKDKDNEWCVINLSMIVLFTGSGSTSGTCVPQTYAPNNMASFGYTTYFKKGTDWSKPKNRETFEVKTMDIGATFANGEGRPHYLLRLQYTDERGRVGRGIDAVTVWQNNGVFTSRTTHPIFFDKV